MTLSEFTAEIENSLESFVSSGDIDRNTIRLNVLTQLRIFGNNITELKEKVLDIENSKVKLPDEFKSLRLALKIEPFGCDSKEDLSDTYIYRQRIENPAYFDEVNQEYITSCNSKIITETITLNNKAVNFYYHPQWLSLTKGIKKDTLAVDCLNINPAIRNSYPHQINITNTTLNTNFSKGQIYIQYNALPTTDEGEIIIPELTTGDIFRYLEVYIKVKLAEDIIANNKNPQGLTQLYSMWTQQLPQLKRAALVESKFSGLDKNWGKVFKARNKADMSKFNLPNLTF